MRSITFTLLAIFAFLVSSCSDLTDDEKKFIGTWSTEQYGNSVLDEQSGVRMIYGVNSLETYNEDKTYNDKGDFIIKIEVPYSDATVRLYAIYHYNAKLSWSADKGVYSDSTLHVSLSDNLVSYNNIVAIRDNQTGEIKRFGLYDKELDEICDNEIIKNLRNGYNEIIKEIRTSLFNTGKTIYKIKSISDNEIVYEDNDGVQTTLKKGKIMSARIRQMIVEGKALR